MGELGNIISGQSYFLMQKSLHLSIVKVCTILQIFGTNTHSSNSFTNSSLTDDKVKGLVSKCIKSRHKVENSYGINRRWEKTLLSVHHGCKTPVGTMEEQFLRNSSSVHWHHGLMESCRYHRALMWEV